MESWKAKTILLDKIAERIDFVCQEMLENAILAATKRATKFALCLFNGTHL